MHYYILLPCLLSLTFYEFINIIAHRLADLLFEDRHFFGSDVPEPSSLLMCVIQGLLNALIAT